MIRIRSYFTEYLNLPYVCEKIISEFAAITSTVKYLSNETIQSDGSSLGNQFSNLQPDIEETLGNKA